jgi:hypothetical protein
MFRRLSARINARTIVLDAVRQKEATMLSLHPDSRTATPAPTRVRVAFPSNELVSGEEPVCANPICSNLVLEVWEETGRYCARCAIEQDLYDREARRERVFSSGPF